MRKVIVGWIEEVWRNEEIEIEDNETGADYVEKMENILSERELDYQRESVNVDGYTW